MGLFGGNSGSGAAEMAAKYAALVEFLEGIIAEIEEDVGMVEDALNKIHDAFQSYEDSAQGLIIDTFEFKENSVFHKQYTTIIQNMRMGVDDLEMKKDMAEQFKGLWEQKAELEEMQANAGF